MWKGIKIFAMFLLPALTMMSCSGSGEFGDDDAAESNAVQISITLSTNSITRATWGDDYVSETATSREDYINPRTLKVLLFDTTTGECIGQVDNMICYQNSYDKANVYEVVGTLDVEDGTVDDQRLSCKMVVLANYEGDVSSVATLSDLSSLTFTIINHLATDVAAGKASIPMFGVRTCTNLQVRQGERTDAGTIDMLRAMAKIKVSLELDSNGDNNVTTGEHIAIASVTMTNHNATGYLVPKGYSSVSETNLLTMIDTETWDWAADQTFNPYASASTGSVTLAQNANNEFYVYVPECSVDGARPKFSVTFDFQTDSDTETYDFDFDKYTTDGEAEENNSFHIERNHVYGFVITILKGSFKVSSTEWTNTFTNEYTFEKRIT